MSVRHRGVAVRRAGALAVAAALLDALAPGGAEAAVPHTVVNCAAGRCWPAAFTFTPKGKRLFYIERFTGEIHRVDPRTGADDLWATLPASIDGAGERGALGIALDPRWDRKAKTRKAKRRRRRHRWVSVFYTNASPLENRIIRLRKPKGGGLDLEVLLTISIASGTNHNGGVIHVGRDGKLYAVTGDQAEPGRSQDLGDPAGKVLRLNRDGSRPGDNPIAGSLAYSFGHRNSFGFTFDPLTGEVWQTENGPTCDDEINHILPGANYGWGPDSMCPDTSESGPSPIGPEHVYNPVVVPTGATFCSGCGLGDAVAGDLVVGVYGDGTIRHYSLDAGGDHLTSESVLYDHPQGVLAVESRPRDGSIYFSDPDGIYRLT